MKFKYCSNKNTKIINLLINEIEHSDINDSLDLAYFLGEVLFNNQIPFFDISEVEEKLIEKTYSNINNFSDFSIENNGFLFVVSEPYITGGHTRLMENLSLMIDKHKELIVTKSINIEVKNRLNTFFPKIIECYREKKENSLSFISKLVDNFLRYNSIILNIHPEDIYSIVACGIAKKINKDLKIYFVNHADHSFTYGITVANYWFELSLYGSNIDNLKNIKGKRTFLGIPINKPDKIFSQKISYSSLCYATNFITAGSAIKYKPLKKYSIFPLIKTLLLTNNGLVLNVIGVDLIKNYWWWSLKLKFFNRLKLYKSLPYEKYIDLTAKADCYIDSHPFPGGTAFVEQFLNGIPCIGLKSSFFGYTPLEKLKKDNIEEVIFMLNNSPTDEEILDVQKLIFEVHGFSQVKNRFIKVLEEGSISINPMLNFIESQELIFFDSKKINLSVDFIRFLYKYDKSLYFKILFSSSFLSIIKYFIFYFSRLRNKNWF